MPFGGLKVLKSPKWATFENVWKKKCKTLFFHSETIRMPFEGVKILKSPLSTQCYPFASVLRLLLT